MTYSYNTLNKVGGDVLSNLDTVLKFTSRSMKNCLYAYIICVYLYNSHLQSRLKQRKFIIGPH